MTPLKTQLRARFENLIRDAQGEASLIARLSEHLHALAKDRNFLNAILLERLSDIALYRENRTECGKADVILARGSNFAISLRIADVINPGNLTSNAELCFVVSACDKALHFRRFTSDQPFDLDVYDPTVQLIECPVETAAPYEVLIFNNPFELFEIDIVERMPLLTLVVNRNHHVFRTTQIWSFSRTTLRPAGVASNEFRDSALLNVCDALVEFDSESSIAPLHHLARNARAHFVRWAAIKALAALDADEALTAAKLALNDVHPHVRASASAAVDQLS